MDICYRHRFCRKFSKVLSSFVTKYHVNTLRQFIILNPKKWVRRIVFGFFILVITGLSHDIDVTNSHHVQTMTHHLSQSKEINTDINDIDNNVMNGYLFKRPAFVVNTQFTINNVSIDDSFDQLSDNDPAVLSNSVYATQLQPSERKTYYY